MQSTSGLSLAAEISFGISSGGCCKSSSNVIILEPRQYWNPARVVRNCPTFDIKSIPLTSLNRREFLKIAGHVSPSMEESLTRIISYETFSLFITDVVLSTSSSIQPPLLKQGITMEYSGLLSSTILTPPTTLQWYCILFLAWT